MPELGHMSLLQLSLLRHTRGIVISVSGKEHNEPDRDGQSDAILSDWAKAALVARASGNLCRHSAVRLEAIDVLLSLLHHDITPLVDLGKQSTKPTN